jgi:hypothetical protein
VLEAVLLFGAFKYEDLYSVRNYIMSGAVFLFGAFKYKDFLCMMSMMKLYRL